MTPFILKPLMFKPLTLIKNHPPLAYALSGMVAEGIIWLSLTPLDELPFVPGGETRPITSSPIARLPFPQPWPSRV